MVTPSHVAPSDRVLKPEGVSLKDPQVKGKRPAYSCPSLPNKLNARFLCRVRLVSSPSFKPASSEFNNFSLSHSHRLLPSSSQAIFCFC
jgi:hypothetical protein